MRLLGITDLDALAALSRHPTNTESDSLGGLSGQTKETPTGLEALAVLLHAVALLAVAAAAVLATQRRIRLDLPEQRWTGKAGETPHVRSDSARRASADIDILSAGCTPVS